MKTTLTLLLLLSFSISYSQYKLEIIKKSDTIKYVFSPDENVGQAIRIPLNGKDDEFKDLTIGKLENTEKDTFNLDVDGKIKLIYEYDKGKQIINFTLIESDVENDEFKHQFKFCGEGDDGKFNLGKEECPEETTTPKKKNKYDDITLIPYPFFKEKREILTEYKTNRYLILDANPNPLYNFGNQLYKRVSNKKCDDNDENLADDPKKNCFENNFEIVNNLRVNQSLGVFLRYYNLHDIEDITVSIEGTDYSYNQDLSDIADATEKNDDQQELESKPENSGTEATNTGKDEKENLRTKYLDDVYDQLKKFKYLSISDILVLQEYKKVLLETITRDENPATLNEEGLKTFSKINSWYPDWVLLTPISPVIPDTDRVEIETSIKKKNIANREITKVGDYKTVGGLAFNLGSMVYYTGLKNSSVFRQMVDVGGTQEQRAALEDGESLGIGLNAEIGFRTGSLINPTINVGFFVPFEENITPIFALGPGFNISSSKVRIGFSGGLAFGRINSIRENFRDIDLSMMTNLANEELTEQVWDISWYFGIGLSYNISGN